MNRSWGGVILRVFLLCLVVGMALTFAGITPEDLLLSLGSTVQRIFNALVSMVRWTVPYVLVGAVVVVPVWVVMMIWRFARHKIKDKE